MAVTASKNAIVRSIVAFIGVAMVTAPSLVAGVKQGDRPTFAFKTPDGTEINSDKLRGKIIVVDFWATAGSPVDLDEPLKNAVKNNSPHS